MPEPDNRTRPADPSQHGRTHDVRADPAQPPQGERPAEDASLDLTQVA